MASNNQTQHVDHNSSDSRYQTHGDIHGPTNTMTQISFFSGYVKRSLLDRYVSSDRGEDTGQPYRWVRYVGDRALFIETSGDRFAVAEEGDILLMIRGYAVPKTAEALPDQGSLAMDLLRDYRQHGELRVDDLDGSFTVILLDGRQGRVSIYRNLVGNGFTYYRDTSDGLFFGSNLANLVARLDSPLSVDQEALPVYFLYRMVPGRKTLIEGISQLCPGELLIHEQGQQTVSQRRTLGDFEESMLAFDESIELLEETMGRIASDHALLDPNAANLLSGGVDSSYIQAHWNAAIRHTGVTPVTAVASVDHAMTHADHEYTMSAVQAFNTSHFDTPINAPYWDYLVKAIATTGVPPNHVQSAYFGPLATEMNQRGLRTGLCGEGADSLFGTGWSNLFHRAELVRRLIPTQPMRNLAVTLASALRRDGWNDALRLAGYADVPTHWLHPVNRAAQYAHIPSVQQCFGQTCIDDAYAYRRFLLEQHQIQATSLHQVHAIGFLGAAMDTASLWAAYFNHAGMDLRCPYLDSRLLRVALNIEPESRFSPSEPKVVLKHALCRHMPRELVYRPKLGFGQPIFEWLSDGGQLASRVKEIGEYDFVPADVLSAARSRPNWFLYSLLCYDVWHKLFIEGKSSAELSF